MAAPQRSDTAPAPAALITGGTSGIGLATAQLLRERGSRVMVTGSNPDTIARARTELPDDVVVVRADIRSLKDTDRVVAEAPAGSRGALLAMLPSLTIELAPRRIRVNAVSPGLTDTPIWARSGASPDQLGAMKDSVAATIPFGRLAAPRDIAETVAFLASERAAYITGQNVVVDGGLLSVSFAEPRTG